MKEIFRKNLRNNYLMMLRDANYKPNGIKRQFCNINPEVGDIVIIHEEDMRLRWRMGIIEKLIDSSDDQVRKAEVRMIIRDKNIEKNKSLKTVIRTKAVFQLYPLELKVRQDFFDIQEEKRDQEDQELIELSEEIIDSEE